MGPGAPAKVVEASAEQLAEQAAAEEASGIGGWYLVSCMAKQISEFMVQA